MADLPNASTVVQPRELMSASSEELASDAAALPRRFGDYELLAKIAQGGMGVVYRARQVDLDRTVAVKMILAGQFASDAEVERFHAEALAAAQLQHPSIVAIHEVGKVAGQHFFSMDYVDGQPLGDLVRENPLPARRAAAYVVDISEAIHYAHTHGVLHRDLKPANVLVDRSDRPRVTDFGLAKRIDDASNLTATGAILGTPSYMPPEQIRGDREQFGPPTDVYALGAILYELLTTRPPFRAESPLDTFVQVVNNEPVAPRLLNAKVPRDLETICLKCLEKSTTRRYETAAALAADLRRFLAGEPILARPVGRAERLVRWCRRRPALAALAAALVLAVVVGFAAVTWQWRKAEENRRLAEANFTQAVAAASKTIEAVDEWLRSLPAASDLDPAQKKSFEDAINVYRSLQELNRGDAASRLETARGYGRLGSIYTVLNRPDDATAAYNSAIGELARLAAEFPRDAVYRQALAETENSRGQALQRSPLAAQQAGAVAAYDAAIRLAQELTAENEREPEHRRVLASAHYNRGVLASDALDLAAASSDFKLALDLQLNLIAERPAVREYRHELARTHNSRGSLFRSQQQLDLALSEFAKALALYDELLAHAEQSSRSDRDYVYESAVAAMNRGNALRQQAIEATDDAGRQASLVEARHDYSQAIERLRQLTARYPGVPFYLEDLAKSYNNQGIVLALQATLAEPDGTKLAEEYAEVLAAWSESQRAYENLIEIRPASTAYRQLLGEVLLNLAQVKFQTDETEELLHTVEARKLLDRAITEQHHVLEADPQSQFARTALAREHVVRAEILLALGDPRGASADVQRASDLAPNETELVLTALAVLAGCLSNADRDPDVTPDATSTYAAQGAKLVRQSLAADILSVDDLRSNSELEPLLARPELEALLKPSADAPDSAEAPSP